MKAHYKTADGRIVFEVNGENPKALFEQIAGVQGLFEAETECGVCRGMKDGQPHGKGIRFTCRSDNEGNKYYGLLCLNCFAEFHFGQHRTGGGLFPKRKKEGEGGKLENLPNRGWAKFERQKPNGPATQPPLAGSRAEQPRTASAPRQYEPPEHSGPGITDDDVPF